MMPYEIIDVGKHWFIIHYHSLHHYKIIANSIEPSKRIKKQKHKKHVDPNHKSPAYAFGWWRQTNRNV